MGRLSTDQERAIGAIANDTNALVSLLQFLVDFPKSSLLTFGLLPSLSMFVVESLHVIQTSAPRVATELLANYAESLKPFRNQAKLLDDSEKRVEDILIELTEISSRQRQYFLEPHIGMLGKFKRAIQPDIGLYTYEGHIFSTTHSIAYSLGQFSNQPTSEFDIGHAAGAYISALKTLLGGRHTETSGISSHSILPNAIEMRDIKSQSLYRRGSLGQMPEGFSVGATHLLASLNYSRHILQRLLPERHPTQFRLKFIVGYHADSNLRRMQDQLRGNGAMPEAASKVFEAALGNPDSRWIRKRSKLRNLLTHYLVDEDYLDGLPTTADWFKAIEHFGGRLKYEQIDALVDRHIERMTDAIEEGFSLDGDPFWYGRVK